MCAYVAGDIQNSWKVSPKSVYIECCGKDRERLISRYIFKLLLYHLGKNNIFIFSW